MLGSSKYWFSIGPPSVELLHGVLNQVFENVVEVDKIPPFKTRGLELEGFIEPILDNPSDFYPSLMGAVGSWVRIIYHFKFYSSKGDLISNFMVKGESGSETEKGSISKAMEYAAKNFRPAFLKEMGVQRWLYKIRSKKAGDS